MQLPIFRIDKSLPLPGYQTDGAAGFDLYARTQVEIAPSTSGLIPANLIVQLPPGHFLMVALRSSTPLRTGLTSPHGSGIGDPDYCGPDDELRVLVFNPTPAPVTVTRGERIAQAIVVPAQRPELVECQAIEAPSRGGFGSTGA